MSKIVITKKFNVVILAVILLAGTITLFSPSFMTTASAQAESYYGMENGYGSYEPEPEYGMDSYKKSYRNDYYEQPREYPSYKEDYKQGYPKYIKDNKEYKSKKDSSSSVSINKLN